MVGGLGCWGKVPVKEIFLTRGCRQRASLREGVFARLVGNMFSTPGGKPASVANLATAKADMGVSGDGFTIMVQPAASAAPALRKTMAIGKFHGTRAAATPRGCLIVKTRRPGREGVKTVPWMRSASPANHL